MLFWIVFIVVASLFLILANWLMIREFYWGPSGRPPQDKGEDKKLHPDEKDSPPEAAEQ